jgi:FkbM family methyltransferase
MVEMIETRINKRWTLLLPEHRAARAEWFDGWEKERLASMHTHLSYKVEQWERRNGFAEGIAGRATLSPRPLIVDVGAEEGDFPALFSKWGCDLILVEPNPKVWPNVRAIWNANELRMPLMWWVGFASDHNDFDPIHNNVGSKGFVADDGWPWCAAGEVIGDHGFRHLAQQADSTPCIQLDELCRSHKVDAITIDVEGSELRVLHGSHRILRDDRPTVWVSCHTDYEWNDQMYAGVRSADVCEFMDGQGYDYELLAVDHEEHWMFTPR